ncbi:MAG TPA: NADH-quinone oxidoreductase subunit D, partial [Thermoanaerobaculia bacterium]|nr:NADH-quinone oxidoreductase subunit D [Thermoanaerobaculia bacterium]
MELNFGPQHPSTHGVLRLVLKVDGEKILEAKPDVGYLHRGTEKLFETETYPMGIPHTDRMDYVAAATNNHAFCLTIEKLLGVEIPRRAQLVRVILDELQ